ncbi:MAG: orotidine-5'-phosphate decarboxylase [Planctomycetes bacterium]|nr:orotidine-5'-phosphate decarboxylase [Planctomycetota bacterium]
MSAPNSANATQTPSHAADRLLAAISSIGSPVCVGIDPVLERLPACLTPSSNNFQAAISAITSFTQGILEAVAGIVPCVKFQSACFERYGHLGVKALEQLISHAKQQSLQVILDAKRGDIGISADHYAAAAFEQSQQSSDWITINSYFGRDGIEPFLRNGCGAFCLVRTSNPSSDHLQSQELVSGETVAQRVASMVAEIGTDSIGDCGYSSLGAVVGATKPRELAALRELMPQQIFLVPGFGAQGGTVDDIRPCFSADGKGALITASRSVIYAFNASDDDWKTPITEAAKALADQIAEVV